MSEHEHIWNCGSGWALWIDRTMPRGQDAWWFRDCDICRRSEWRRKLDWQLDNGRAIGEHAIDR